MAVFAPVQIRFPLISTPIKFLFGKRFAKPTVYSPFPQPSSNTIGLVFLKYSLCQLPFKGNPPSLACSNDKKKQLSNEEVLT